MKKTDGKLIILSCFWLITLTVLVGIGAAQAQTVTYKRAVKMPPRLNNVNYFPLSDTNFGATDLGSQAEVTPYSRYLFAVNRLYPMRENGDGTAYFNPPATIAALASPSEIAERYVNPNLPDPADRIRFAIVGVREEYKELNQYGVVVGVRQTNLQNSAVAAVGYGGGNTSIFATYANASINGVTVRLASYDRSTHQTTAFSGDVGQQTGKNLGMVLQMVYGADEILYLLDFVNRRVLKFGTGANGVTRGALLGSFDLDSTKPANNSMTIDPAGNIYVGDGDGGFNMYDSSGQWKQGFDGTYWNDPDALTNLGFKPNMNYYASGLNDGNGTLDIRDATGYRQYTITAPGQTPVIRITSEPQSQIICQSLATNLSVTASGANLTYQWRKNGVYLTDGVGISGATTANLQISSTALNDAGYYDVLVRKPGAIVTSQAAIISVTPTPVITRQPSNQSIRLGETATFTASADNSPNMQWQVSSDGGTTFSNIDGATSGTLNIPAVVASQIGNHYRAVFASLCGDSVISSAATLKLSQTISFANPGEKTVGDPAFDLGGTASSGLIVSYTVLFGQATVAGSTLTINNSGIVSIKASQSGNNFYTGAPDVTQTFLVKRTGNSQNSYTVDTISDDITLNACTSAPNDCSLRAAVFVANISAGDETINFEPSLANQVIVLNSVNASYRGELIIADNGKLTINGLGADQLKISGNNQSRVFFAVENAEVFINDLTITNGKGDGGYDNGYGGAVYNLKGAVTLNNVTVSGSSAPQGGGIYNNDGRLQLIRSQITGNATSGGGRGGGIISISGTLDITDSTISGNSTLDTIDRAGAGGGLVLVYGIVTMSNSTVSGNRSLNNVNGGHGGGFYISGSTVTLQNSTISGNMASGGGGIYVTSNFGSATIRLNNMTVTDNRNRGLSVGSQHCGGIYNATASSAIYVSNSIIAKNGTYGERVFDVNGNFISEGYNLIGSIFTNPSHPEHAAGFGATGDKFGINYDALDAKLLPLDFYGGVTKTHQPAIGSPAIDAGSSNLSTDQRGFIRPFDDPSVINAAGGNGTDIGAVEMQPAVIHVSLPTAAVGSIGGTVTIPVTISQIPDNLPIESFDFAVFYNPNVLQPAASIGSSSGTLSANCSAIPNSPVSGRVNVSGTCAQAFTNGNSGVLYNLTFNIIGAVNQTSNLSFINPANNANTFRFNGAPTIAGSNGQFTVLAPTAADAFVSGRVLTPDGRGLMNAVVIVTDDGGRTRTAVTGAFGYFQVDNLEVGQTHIIEIRSKIYSFAPRIITVMEDLTELNFTAQ